MVSSGFVVGRPVAPLTHSIEFSLFSQRTFLILEVVQTLLSIIQLVYHFVSFFTIGISVVETAYFLVVLVAVSILVTSYIVEKVTHR